MLRVILVVLVLGAVLSWPGCAGGSSGELFRPAMLAQDEAVIYVFRESQRAARSGRIAVYINQEYQGDLRPGEHLAYVTGPGEYLVRVEARGSMVREVRVAAGNVAYERVEMQRRGRAVIDDVEPELGRRLIAKSHRIAAPEEPKESGAAEPRQSETR